MKRKLNFGFLWRFALTLISFSLQPRQIKRDSAQYGWAQTFHQADSKRRCTCVKGIILFNTSTIYRKIICCVQSALFEKITFIVILTTSEYLTSGDGGRSSGHSTGNVFCNFTGQRTQRARDGWISAGRS